MVKNNNNNINKNDQSYLLILKITKNDKYNNYI